MMSVEMLKALRESARKPARERGSSPAAIGASCCAGRVLRIWQADVACFLRALAADGRKKRAAWRRMCDAMTASRTMLA
jgi:hypothetical protein